MENFKHKKQGYEIMLLRAILLSACVMMSHNTKIELSVFMMYFCMQTATVQQEITFNLLLCMENMFRAKEYIINVPCIQRIAQSGPFRRRWNLSTTDDKSALVETLIHDERNAVPALSLPELNNGIQRMIGYYL